MSDRLFEHDSSRPPEKLFDEQSPNAAPLFQEATEPVAPLFDNAPNVDAVPLFGHETSVAPALPIESLPPAPVLPVEPLAAPQTATQPALAVEPLRDMPKPAEPAKVAPEAVFDSEDDPIVRQAMRHAEQQFAALFASHGRLLHDRFRLLFPLEFRKITDHGDAALQTFRTTIAAVSEITTHVSALGAADTIRQIVQDAQTHNDHSVGFRHLLHSVEHALAPFNTIGSYTRLDRLAVEIKLVYDKLLLMEQSATAAFDHLKIDSAALSVAASMAGKTEFETHLVRRRDMFLTGTSELDLAVRQIAALKMQIENTTLQIDEMRNTTLPSLGFLRTITQS